MDPINPLQRFLCWVFRIPFPPAKEFSNDLCVCDHTRNTHTKGVGNCHAWEDSKGEDRVRFPAGFKCSCQVFIKRGNGYQDSPETPSPEELEKLYQK